MARNRPLPVPLEELPLVLRLEHLTAPLDWSAVFGRRAPVELEIGSGKGLFLIETAKRRPDVDFLGVERAEKWFRRAADRVWRAGLPNIRMVGADAFDFLQRWVPPASVSAVHVYFPDPWPKKRHAKRRLLQEELYTLAERALIGGGEFRLASDVPGYFEEALLALAARKSFRRAPWPEDEEAGGLPTNFAVKYRLEGRALHCARFLVKPVGAQGGGAEAGALAAGSARVLGSRAGGES